MRFSGVLFLSRIALAPKRAYAEAPMELDDSFIRSRLKALIPKERQAEAIIYLDTQLKDGGVGIQLGKREVTMPFRGYFLFVDLLPMANWGHPALGVFLSETGDQVMAVPTEFPPFFGDPPATYRQLEP
jgi:hypothetical protein